VTLLLDGSPRAVAVADLVAIEAAARPLLDELRRRGLCPESGTSGASGASGTSTASTEPAPPASPGRPST
jgi:hypothetical protein